MKLKNYRPESIFKIPVTRMTHANYPVINMHSHDYSKTAAALQQRINNMDSTGMQKTMILSYETGPAFDSVVKRYSVFPDRFAIWCGIDFTGYQRPGWSRHAIRELERCKHMGAIGVGFRRGSISA